MPQSKPIVKPLAVLTILAALLTIGALVLIVISGYRGVGLTYSASVLCNPYLILKFEAFKSQYYGAAFLAAVVSLCASGVQAVVMVREMLKIRDLQGTSSQQVYEISTAQLNRHYLFYSLAIFGLIPAVGYYLSLSAQKGRCLNTLYLDWLAILLLTLVAFLMLFASWAIVLKYAVGRQQTPMSPEERDQLLITPGELREKQNQMKNVFEMEGASEVYKTVKRGEKDNKEFIQPLLYENKPIPLQSYGAAPSAYNDDASSTNQAPTASKETPLLFKATAAAYINANANNNSNANNNPNPSKNSNSYNNLNAYNNPNANSNSNAYNNSNAYSNSNAYNSPPPSYSGAAKAFNPGGTAYNEQKYSPNNKQSYKMESQPYAQKRKMGLSPDRGGSPRKSKTSLIIEKKKKRFREINPLKNEVKDVKEEKPEEEDTSYRIEGMNKSFMELIKENKKPVRKPPPLPVELVKPKAETFDFLSHEMEKDLKSVVQAKIEQLKKQKKQESSDGSIEFIEEPQSGKKPEEEEEVAVVELQKKHEAELFYHRPKIEGPNKNRKKKQLFEEQVGEQNQLDLFEEQDKDKDAVFIVNKLKQNKSGHKSKAQKALGKQETAAKPARPKKKEDLFYDFLKSKYQEAESEEEKDNEE